MTSPPTVRRVHPQSDGQ